MINLETQTPQDPSAVLDLAEQFFGPQGEGLKVESRSRNQLFLVGGGGSVGITANRHSPGRPTTVQVQAREWEAAAKAFVGQLPTRPRSDVLRKVLSWLKRRS